MDKLLLSLHDVSLVLLPTIGVVCLVLLAMILYRIYKIVQELPKTVTKIDGVIDATQRSVDKLDAPLTTLNNVSNTVDLVNDSAVGFASKAVNMSIKHSDAIVEWFRNNQQQRTQRKEEKEVRKEARGHAEAEARKAEEKVEDFGIYD
ncbi:hypothetical protein [Erysipelothrix aquatica]|uniref:hypothetical protein n=1 Tax=Erysipelothrix aquatica TaxID=2683714 RepID=UPI001358927F|nr:hypothetical protein [Erysipelothrix aquatica]